MNRVVNSFHVITLALVLAFSMAAIGTAVAGNPLEPNWLWPTKSIAVAQSTKALILGRDTNAISHAQRELDKLRDYDRVVALQNLCLGWLRVREQARAAPFCDSAVTAATVLPPSRKKNDYSTLDVVKANIKLTRDLYVAQDAKVTDESNGSRP